MLMMLFIIEMGTTTMVTLWEWSSLEALGLVGVEVAEEEEEVGVGPLLGDQNTEF